MSYYSMFTLEGEVFVDQTLQMFKAMVENGEIKRPDFNKAIRAMSKDISKVHEEVWDTEPQWAICDWINKNVCEPNGFIPTDRWDW